MRKQTIALACCLATVLAFGAGCRSTPVEADPAITYDADDVIVSGLPPLACGITKPVVISVIDETSRSRVFYLDARGEGFEGLLKLDVEKQALILTTGEEPGEISLLKINPKHRYTVVFSDGDNEEDEDEDHDDGEHGAGHDHAHDRAPIMVPPVTRPSGP